MNKSQLLLLKMVATFLMRKNGSTTTLEIKDELRRRFPRTNWIQSEISDAMIEIHANQEFQNLTFQDTGEFRIYLVGDGSPVSQPDPNAVLNTPPPVGSLNGGATVATFVSKPKSKTATLAKYDNKTPKSSNLSRTAVVDLMRDSKGRFYTVTFIKTDGSERTMNGQTKKDNFMDNLGYINFRESNGNIRRVNPKTIKEISISGNVYKVK